MASERENFFFVTQGWKADNYFFEILNLKGKSSKASCSGEASKKLVKVNTSRAIINVSLEYEKKLFSRMVIFVKPN